MDDFAWWCGLGKTICKQAITLIEKELTTIEFGEKTYYSFQKEHTVKHSLQFIGGFDEYFLGYKDRSVIADIEHHEKLFTKNGIFFPIILQDGRAVGVWKRTYKKDTVVFAIEFLPKCHIEKKFLEKECQRYTEFVGYKKFEIKN